MAYCPVPNWLIGITVVPAVRKTANLTKTRHFWTPNCSLLIRAKLNWHIKVKLAVVCTCLPKFSLIGVCPYRARNRRKPEKFGQILSLMAAVTTRPCENEPVMCSLLLSFTPLVSVFNCYFFRIVV